MTMHDAIADLERVLHEREHPAGGTFGPADSLVLLALARVVIAYVRWQVGRGTNPA